MHAGVPALCWHATALLAPVRPAYSCLLACLQVWRQNTEAERLLGVSLTGVMDNTMTSGRRGQVSEGVVRPLQQSSHTSPSSLKSANHCHPNGP